MRGCGPCVVTSSRSLIAALAACTDAIEPGGSERPDEAAVTCEAIRELPSEGRSHVPVGAPIEAASPPATSGPHYPSWLDPAGPVLDQPVDQGLEGYAVHNLEHERLPDAGAVEEMRAFWKERLARLAETLG